MLVPGALIFLLGCTAFVPSTFSNNSLPEKNVLILYSFSPRETFSQLEPLKKAAHAGYPGPIHFYVEYLESLRFSNAKYRNAVADATIQTYRSKHIDLIVAVVYPALQFALDYRDQLGPDLPIVFATIAQSRIAGGIPWTRVTGVTSGTDLQGSLNLALILQPAMRNVAVIAGPSDFEQYWARAFGELVRRSPLKLGFSVLPAIENRIQLNQSLQILPNSALFYDVVPQESSQAEIGTYEALELVSKDVPTYCLFRYCLDHGGIGAHIADEAMTGMMAGNQVARILNGSEPKDIPVVNSWASYTVNWRQLQRWKIPESALPDGTLILYRQPSLWGNYRGYIVAAVALILLQAAMIAIVLLQRVKGRRSAAKLQESEKRFRVMAETTPSLIWMSNRRGEIIYLNEKRISFTGEDPHAGYGDTWKTFIHPDDLQKVIDSNREGVLTRVSYSKEYRLRRQDGIYRWMLDIAAPRVDGDGSFAGFIGSANDVTDQKLAQEALEKTSGRLIEAQEKERSRIARELHDDICQRLALLSLELEQTNQSLNDLPSVRAARMLEIRQHCSDIAGDVQALSHKLHSSKLDYLGLVSALRGFCNEFSCQNQVVVEFHVDTFPDSVPRSISLCLFRVAQEALHNAVKHSGSDRFLVDLSAGAGQLHLNISDSGVGFDIDQAHQFDGLGLVSMQERVHSIKGSLIIQSAVGQGTSVSARVPFTIDLESVAESEPESQAAFSGSSFIFRRRE